MPSYHAFGDCPPLVCFGAPGADPAEFGDLRDLSLERTVIVPDARSAEDVEVLRGQLGVERISVFAHGSGAQVVGPYLLRHSNHVDRLVLVAPDADLDDLLTLVGFTRFHKPMLVVDVDPDNPTTAMLMERMVQSARRFVLPDAGRFPWRDAPDAFRAIMLAYLGHPGVPPYDALGDGPPLVCFSGGQAMVFDQAQGGVAALGDLGGLSAHRTLVRLDPGDIRSDEIDETVADVDALRVHLGLDRMAVLTHLTSAFLPLFWAAAQPERVDRLVIVTPFAMVYDDSDGPSQAERNALARIDSGDGTPADWEIFTAAYSRIATTREPHVVALRAGLAKVTAPVLVLTGEQDIREIAVMADAVASLFVNAERVVLPNTERFPWRAAPGAFRETVENFLSA